MFITSTTMGLTGILIKTESYFLERDELIAIATCNRNRNLALALFTAMLFVLTNKGDNGSWPPAPVGFKKARHSCSRDNCQKTGICVPQRF